MGRSTAETHHPDSSQKAPFVAGIDEFKGAWRALGTLAPDRLSALRRVTMGDAIRLTGGNRNTLKQHFRALLVEQGHLVQHGAGRGVWYELKQGVMQRRHLL